MRPKAHHYDHPISDKIRTLVGISPIRRLSRNLNVFIFIGWLFQHFIIFAMVASTAEYSTGTECRISKICTAEPSTLLPKRMDCNVPNKVCTISDDSKRLGP